MNSPHPSRLSRTKHAALLAAIAAIAAATTLSARPAAANDGKQSDDIYRVGVSGVLAGPVGNYGLTVGTQVLPMLELQAGAVTQSPEASSTTGSATATASITVLTPFLRGRFWAFKHHVPLLEAGVALCHYSIAADSSDTSGNAIEYTRSGNLPIVFAGAGYGWRSDFGLRITAVIGYMQFLSATADPSTVTTTGAFDASDRASIRSSLDESTDDLAASRPYLDLSIGWVF